VENAVGYVKKNFLAGQAFIDFSAVQPAARAQMLFAVHARDSTGVFDLHHSRLEEPLASTRQDDGLSIGLLQEVSAFTSLNSCSSHSTSPMAEVIGASSVTR
jgi:hypothetical protein